MKRPKNKPDMPILSPSNAVAQIKGSVGRYLLFLLLLFSPAIHAQTPPVHPYMYRSFDTVTNNNISDWADHDSLTSQPQTPDRWSDQKARQWYNRQPWRCGINYIPANAISYTEMWMPYGFDPDFIDKELALAEEIGFNCLRVVLPFVVWEHDPDAFKTALDEFLTICDKRGIAVMFILFDKDTLINFVSVETRQAPQWIVAGEQFTVNPGTQNIETRQSFSDCQLHIEWKTPQKPVLEGKTGQQNGNSGIYLMSKYEIQVLNSFHNQTSAKGQAAAFYGNSAPLVNASLQPDYWQVYDIIFKAPKYNEGEELVEPGYLTLLHNGVLVLNHVQIIAPTPSHNPAYSLAETELPLMLQDHNNEVSYRNIWIRKLD